MDDKELVLMYEARDESVFSKTLEKYGRYARFISDNILSDERDGEECVNDALLAVWNSIPPNKPDSLKAYIARLVRNTALDRIRKQSADKRRADRLSDALGELEECAGGTTPEEELDAKQLKELINCFVGTLEKKQRIAFVKRYWYLCTPAQIADDLDMKVNAVNVMLHRTREQLKAYIKKEGYDV